MNAAGLLLKATDDIFGVTDALIALTELVVLIIEVATFKSCFHKSSNAGSLTLLVKK